jgi:hypothetical protein
MISKLSKLFPPNKTVYLISTPKVAIRPPAPKPPMAKAKPNQLSLSIVAQQLNINE